MQASMTPPAAAPTAASLRDMAKAVAAAPTATSAPAGTAGRSADGDYKVRGAATAQTKDADGDYKPAVSAAAATSTSAVMAAVTSLNKGG